MSLVDGPAELYTEEGSEAEEAPPKEEIEAKLTAYHEEELIAFYTFAIDGNELTIIAEDDGGTL